MTFVSFAQNFEDVMLWRALSGIKTGFYVDAGAWSPDIDSVTRAFYEHGWQGINVEPNPIWHSMLCEKRPRDINLPLALGDKLEMLELYIVGDTGLSTTDIDYAKEHESKGYSIQSISCSITTLDILWEEHVQKREVHFIKVDVEGMEDAVLKGNDWKKHRPWIVLIESTYPNSHIPMYQAWEPILLNADYYFVYEDGLNRFYLAGEHAELSPAFAYPPNFLDDFKVAAQAEAEKEIANLKQRLDISEEDREARLQAIEYLKKESAEQLQVINKLSQALEAKEQSGVTSFLKRFVRGRSR